MECHAKKQPLQNAGELYEVFFAKFSKTIVNRMFMFMISAERCHMPANITGPQTWTKPCWPTNVYTFCVFLIFLNPAVAFKDSHEYIPNVTIESVRDGIYVVSLVVRCLTLQ
jgi:hypothetical protein